MTSVTLALFRLLLVQLLVPAKALIAAKVSEAAGAALLNRVDLVPALTFEAAFLLYDAMFYAVHRVLHEVPFLWWLG